MSRTEYLAINNGSHYISFTKEAATSNDIKRRAARSIDFFLRGL